MSGSTILMLKILPCYFYAQYLLNYAQYLFEAHVANKGIS